jgi:indolepyruvate ferredoxin oxidoreductase beta subunit
MKLDLVLSGVGGQGILSIAFLIDTAALRRGLHVKQAEVHGMSQRGGSVYSHLRVSSNPIMSDLIPEGRADMILSMEPLEVGRYLDHLGKDGVVVTSSTPFANIPNYPSEDSIYRSLFRLGRVVLVDAKAIALKAGAPLAQNVAMLGAAMPFLTFDIGDFSRTLEEKFAKKGEKIVRANLQALDYGARAGFFYKGLLDAGINTQDCFYVLKSLDPATVDPSEAPAFAQRLKARRGAPLKAPLGENMPCVVGSLDSMPVV